MSAVSYLKLDTYEKPYVMIPLSDAALQFYRVRYGINEGLEVHGALNGPFGGVVELMTEKLPYRRHRVSKRMPQRKLTLFLPRDLRFGKVTEKSLVSAGRLLDDFFREQFVSFVQGGVVCGSSQTAAVKLFMEAYKIDIDVWDLDSARMFYRRSVGYEK